MRAAFTSADAQAMRGVFEEAQQAPLQAFVDRDQAARHREGRDRGDRRRRAIPSEDEVAETASGTAPHDHETRFFSEGWREARV